MKRTILTLILVCIAGLICSAKSFYYDGVGFEYGKGWKFSSSPNCIIGVKDDFKIFLAKYEMTAKTEKSRNGQVIASELEKKAEAIMEQSMNSRDKKLLYKSEVTDGDINGIPAKYIEFKYSHKEYHRHYCFEWNGYIFEIELSGKGSKYYKEFEKLLSSFSFNPEVRRNRW